MSSQGASISLTPMRVLAPASNQFSGRGRPLGKKELEAGGQQPAGHDSAALENELRFCPHEEGTDFDEPLRAGQSKTNAPCLAQGPHEFIVGKRAGRGEIDDAEKLLADDQHIDRAYKVSFMNPGNELRSIPLSAAETMANQAREHIEHAPSIRTQSKRAADGDLSCERRGCREESFFPTFCNINRKVPGIGSAWLTAAQFAICFVHRAIQRMPIDGGRAGVNPKPGRGVE